MLSVQLTERHHEKTDNRRRYTLRTLVRWEDLRAIDIAGDIDKGRIEGQVQEEEQDAHGVSCFVIRAAELRHHCSVEAKHQDTPGLFEFVSVTVCGLGKKRRTRPMIIIRTRPMRSTIRLATQFKHAAQLV